MHPPCTGRLSIQDKASLDKYVQEWFVNIESTRGMSSPHWWVLNTHLLSHTVDQLFDLGPVREYWMYVFESYNGKIGRWVKNNAFPIQSIMNGIGRQDMIRFVRGLLMVLRQEEPIPFHTKVITVDPVGVKNVGKNHNLTDLEQGQLTRWMRNNVQQYINLEELVENYNHLISK